MRFHKITRVPDHPRRADQSAVIGIKLTTCEWIPRRGGGGVERGGDPGGRPRPVPLAHILQERDPIPTRATTRAHPTPHPPPSPLRSTRHHFVSLMHIGWPLRSTWSGAT